ncbi:o-succinylbenzoate synthase [Anabaena sphaerica FACHB-251]|uniref:o-succinylbenzoate synthase n=1 Tax=Anabaena sphaerica FACHB-251 TaxID=2692883 RepID=A0A926WL06_9NOST|nr:o-succinylbenzoate synthase [Anabaena sphaerica]MBD2296598.1 o-succinylbenzoate synthase [Anabaena sphaerica FACHB-251]
MIYQFSFRPISQKFTRPVITNHGIWEIRESIIIRLIDVTGRVRWGEISPISWFGSETVEQALKFCHQLPTEITPEIIFDIPDKLPACQFGFESALENFQEKPEFINYQNLTYSGLLPAGEAVLNQWTSLWNQGYKTFKWKIGVDEISKELNIFNSLIQNLPNSAKLRLDANGGLSYQEAKLWLTTCESLKNRIEFIEQPLPVDKFSEMRELSNDYDTKIALDESVATLQQLEDCYKQGWRGIFVIKPGIVGSPSRLRKFCQQHQIDVVFSSVFETEIGRQAALKLAGELSRNHRAVGFGINHYFI